MRAQARNIRNRFGIFAIFIEGQGISAMLSLKTKKPRHIAGALKIKLAGSLRDTVHFHFNVVVHVVGRVARTVKAYVLSLDTIAADHLAKP